VKVRRAWESNYTYVVDDRAWYDACISENFPAINFSNVRHVLPFLWPFEYDIFTHIGYVNTTYLELCGRVDVRSMVKHPNIWRVSIGSVSLLLPRTIPTIITAPRVEVRVKPIATGVP